MVEAVKLQSGIEQLDQFVADVQTIVYAGKSDWWLIEELSDFLGQLVSEQNWLPEVYRQPLPGASYSQYPLYVDPRGAFCVTAVAFGPSMVTPIHNHTVWGAIGVYAGEEVERRYVRLKQPDKSDEAYLIESDFQSFKPGMVSSFLAPDKDIHSIATPPSGSVSLHVYGADIVKIPRLNFDRSTGQGSVVYSCYSQVAKLETVNKI